MCGIFGYVGNQSAAPLLLDGLRTLEYRGYDSAGLFVPDIGAVHAVGPIASLAPLVPDTSYATGGIAHTRWATHGAPTEANAHPHQDAGGQIWLVHNGIIENYQELKAWLQTQGIKFTSDTDTEVLAKLVGMHYQGDIAAALAAALQHVRGTYGVAAMAVQQPDTIVAARLGSPLVAGKNEYGTFLASDPSALVTHTSDVVYLDDGEMVVLTSDELTVSDASGTKVEKAAETIDWSVEAVQKDGYEHFMLKEIMEASTVIEATLRGRLIPETGRVKLGGVEAVLSDLQSVERMHIIGCGSAYYAGLVYRSYFEEYVGIPTEVELGSEYRYKTNFASSKTAALAISQSGETADTLASVRAAKEHGMTTLGVINAVGSTIARDTDAGVHNHAGPEIAVASTKAFISQLTVGVLLTVLLARERGTMSEAEGKEVVTALADLPRIISQVLAQSDTIAAIAKRVSVYEDAVFIGRKLQAPIAYEGALKLKEVAYVHAEGYAGGELKHGPIAMLNEQFPVIAIAPQDDVYDKMVSNIAEVHARKAPLLAVVTEGDTQVSSFTDSVIEVPKVHPLLQPIITTVPLHLLAYYVGVERGYDVDKPRNLAKSVTVE